MSNRCLKQTLDIYPDSSGSSPAVKISLAPLPTHTGYQSYWCEIRQDLQGWYANQGGLNAAQTYSGSACQTWAYLFQAATLCCFGSKPRVLSCQSGVRRPLTYTLTVAALHRLSGTHWLPYPHTQGTKPIGAILGGIY